MKLRVNGRTLDVPDDSTVLRATRLAGVEVPTLCHDDRLKPAGACRLCLVRVRGIHNLVPACATPVTDGMEIETHTPEVEETRRTLLQLLAEDYAKEAVERWPEKQFHRWLRAYGIKSVNGCSEVHGPESEQAGKCESERTPVSLFPLSHFPTFSTAFRDTTHPYLAADMSRCIDCFRCVRICSEVQGQFVWHVTGPGHDARIVPDGATLLTSSCVSCGACVDTCPTGALEDQSILRHGPPTKWTRTTCPYCGVGCEMNVGTREGRIVQVKPLFDAPVSKGHLCVKGRYAFDFTHAADRVTEPMIREDGEWHKVSWPEAIECVANNFSRILEETGPDSLGVLGSARGTNEENYLAQKFARVVLGTNNVDCCARVCHAPTAAGMKQTLGTGAATNSFDDIEHAAAFVVCGCNPTENHPIVGARIKQAVLRGAKLIVIDPREIELVQYADVHLQLRPGTNVPLLHALAHVIVTEGLTDEAALRDRVSDFEAYCDFIAAWTPERAAAITGVSADLIRQAARLYSTHQPAMCFHGLGMTEHVQGTESVMCLVNLALLTGNFGKPGSGVNPLRGQNNVQGAAQMGCEPGNLTGFVPLDQGRDAFEAVWQAPIPHTPGWNLMQMMDAAADQKLRALWAIGYDVALTNPNAIVTRGALAKLDFVVVQDMFMNELAREFGHVFLPACSSFEKDGTFMNSERRVQRVRQALKPLGHSKPDWKIICAVAKAMQRSAGLRPGVFKAVQRAGSETGAPVQGGFDFHSPEEIWNEVRAVWKAGAGISYARLEHGGLQWPCPAEDHPGTTILHAESFPHGQRAPLKRVEFTPTTETTTAEFPFLLTTGRTLYQFNAGTMTMRTPNAMLRATDTLDIAPADARRLSLHDGERVRVRSRHGAAVMPLRLDARVKPGELFATFHTTGVFLNQLTSPHRDRVVMTPEYKVVAVSVEKA
ncbi:MAG: formate dehydrogenase subunit alpha [Verrucomicrobia bacterium]|nr:formate dehydrogenase subunit alpha [Verrucomicrobiota bacterium]